MDSHLLPLFEGTLNRDSNIRQSAEAQLKASSKMPGFLGCCLDILSSEQVDESIKNAAAVYFKNRIIRGWNSTEDPIDNDERPVVRDMLIPAMVKCNVVKLITPALSQILTSDYPKQWPNLIDQCLGLLNANDLKAAHTGLVCLAEVFRTYRWVLNAERQDLEVLIQNLFPSILALGQSLLSSFDQSNMLMGDMLKLVVKIYKFVTYYDLPLSLQDVETFQGWAMLHVQVIQLETAADKHNPWVKAKKWSYHNMYRLFQRYTSESLSKKFDYAKFAEAFLQFQPQLLQLYFTQIENHVALTNECLHFMFSFLEQTFINKQTVKMIAPHYETILRHVIFLNFLVTDEIVEIFESEPQEYISRCIEQFSENYEPDHAANSLLVTAISKKKKTLLGPTVAFANEILSAANASTPEGVKNIEAAFHVISSISEHLCSAKSPYVGEMEGFIHQFVLPQFSSSSPILKTRVCELLSKMDQLNLKPETIGAIFQGVMTCFTDSSDETIPMQIQAALTIQYFINNPLFRESLEQHVMPTMQKLLHLTNLLNTDVISGVTQEFVENFSQELQPFGVELCTNLVQQFLKLANELADSANIDPEEYTGAEDGDKSMAALGLLSTIITVLLSFENSADIVGSIEQLFYPAAEFMVKNDMDYFYEELSDFLENTTFLLSSISPIGWKYLELLSTVFDSTCLYVESFLPVLNNYLVYGAEELKKNAFYTSILQKIFSNAVSSEELDMDELGGCAELATKLVLTVGNNNEILSSALHLLQQYQDDLKSGFGVQTINIVLAHLVNDSSLLNQLDPSILKIWLTLLPQYTRVFDIKLSIMALLSILSVKPDGQLAPVLGSLLLRFPEALKRLQERRKEFDGSAFDGQFDDGDDGWEDDEDDYEEGGEDLSDQYIQMLKKEALDQQLDEDELEFELEEDPLANSVLDNVNIYSLFVQVMNGLGAEQFQVLLSSVDEDQQEMFKQIMTL